MTIKESIERIDYKKVYCNNSLECDCECEKCNEAESMIIDALEKQIPKKPLAFWDGNESLIECPNCKCPIDISKAEWSRQFCGKCGQRLEWE